MHSESGNVEIINYDKAGEVIEEFCESLLKRYQIGLKKLMEHSDFVFDFVHLLYYICYKINLNCGISTF